MSWVGLHQEVFEHFLSSTILLLIPRTEYLVYVKSGWLSCRRALTFTIEYIYITLLLSCRSAHVQPLCHDWSLDSVPLVTTFSDSRNIMSFVLLSFLVALIVVLGLDSYIFVSFDNQSREIYCRTRRDGITFHTLSTGLQSFVLGRFCDCGESHVSSIYWIVCSVWYSHTRHINNIKKLKYVVTLCGLIFLLASLRHTILRNNAWRDSETLYKEDMDVNPLNAKDTIRTCSSLHQSRS